MERALRINIRVLGDKNLASPYIALGKRIVQRQFNLNKKKYHIRMGVHGVYQLEVLLLRDVAFILVETSAGGFFTVDVTRAHSPGSPPFTSYVDTIRRLGCSNPAGHRTHDTTLEALPNNTLALPPRIGQEPHGWYNLRPLEGNHLFYLGSTFAGDEFTLYGVAHKRRFLRRLSKKPKRTDGLSLKEVSPGVFEYQHALPDPFYSRGDLNTFMFSKHSYTIITTTKFTVLLVTYVFGTKVQDSPAQFIFFPIWRWSFDNGDNWTEQNFNQDGFVLFATLPVGRSQTEYVHPGMSVVKNNLFRHYICKINTSTGSIRSVGRIFSVSASFDISSFFTTADDGNNAALTTRFAAMETIPGDASAAGKTSAAIDSFTAGLRSSHCYNLGDGRLILAVRMIDTTNSQLNDVASPVGLAGLRHACYALVSNDYGLTFASTQTWGDNGVNDASIADYSILIGISDQATLALRMNTACALVLSRGVLWRVQFASAAPYDATFYISLNGGDTWTATARPRAGLITPFQVGLPVLIKACADVPFADPARGVGGKFAMNVYDTVAGDWAMYYTKDSGQTWAKGHSWGSYTAPAPQDAARFRSLSYAKSPLLNGVLD